MVLNTLIQYRADGSLRAIAQMADTREAYRLINSVARFSERQQGYCCGLFDRPLVGDVFEWRKSTERDVLGGRVVTRFEVTAGKPRII